MSRISETPEGVLETYDWQDVAEDLKEQLDKYKFIFNKIKEELTGDFNFEVYICNDNKGSGKNMKLGASIYRNMILEKLNELLEEIK